MHGHTNFNFTLYRTFTAALYDTGRSYGGKGDCAHRAGQQNEHFK
jgi:hypothetical protein